MRLRFSERRLSELLRWMDGWMYGWMDRRFGGVVEW